MMSPQAGPSPARVIALIRPVTWQPAPDRRIPDVRDVTAVAPPGNPIAMPILYGGTMGQCMRDSNRAIVRHLHQDTYRDRHRDTRSPNGALTGAYSGTCAIKPARTHRKTHRTVETVRRQQKISLL